VRFSDAKTNRLSQCRSERLGLCGICVTLYILSRSYRFPHLDTSTCDFFATKTAKLERATKFNQKQRFINGTYNTGIEITLKIRQKLPIFLLFALRAVLLCKFFADVLDVDCWCLYNFRIEYRFNGKIRAELSGFSWSSGNTSAVHFSPPLASSAAISISRMKKRQVLDCRANLI
jgi:hypothetical protein